MRWSACLAAVALLLLPAGAFAWTVTVHLHGAGKVVETTPRALMNCTVGPAGKSEASVTDCVAGTPSGIYNSFDVVNLQASVPQDSFDRGWRFLKYVDSSAGGGQINCDPQDTAGDHFSVNCQFQIFENLQTNLYFDDIAGPQDTAISSGPPAATNSTSATLNFDAASDPDATYECRLDRPGEGAASFFACGGPSDKSESFSSLTTNGPYTFYVRGKDPSGNLDSTPASRAWTVDTVAPVVSLTGGPAQGSTVSSTTASFTISASEGTLSCALDAVVTGCGGTYSGLTNGPHTFSARATDAAGNSSPLVSRSWTVNTNAQTFAYTLGNTVSNGVPAAGAGNIEVAGGSDTYTFSATAGQKVFVDQLSATSCSLTWSMTGPGGATVFNSRGICADPGKFTLGSTGTYSLKVTGSATGTYSFRITNVAAPQTFAYTLGSTVVNGTPSAGAGNIELPGSVDSYTFSAAAGQKVFVDQLAASTCSLTWSLTGPSGTTVFASRGICADPGQFTLARTGTYSLRVAGTGSAVGTFSFRITTVAPPQTFAYTVGATVGNGLPAAGAGNIELPGSVDRYTFTGAAGQKVFVDQLAAASCSLTWSLTGPGGATVFASRGICADPGKFTLAAAGTYTLSVAATGGATGTYSFRITNVAAPQTFAYTVGATVSDGVPAAGAGDIELPGSVDTVHVHRRGRPEGVRRSALRVELLADVVADGSGRRHRVRLAWPVLGPRADHAGRRRDLHAHRAGAGRRHRDLQLPDHEHRRAAGVRLHAGQHGQQRHPRGGRRQHRGARLGRHLHVHGARRPEGVRRLPDRDELLADVVADRARATAPCSTPRASARIPASSRWRARARTRCGSRPAAARPGPTASGSARWPRRRTSPTRSATRSRPGSPSWARAASRGPTRWTSTRSALPPARRCSSISSARRAARSCGR